MTAREANDDRERRAQELAKDRVEVPGGSPILADTAAEAVLQTDVMEQQDAEAKATKKIRRVQVIVAIIAVVALLSVVLVVGSFFIITNWSDSAETQPPNDIDPELLNKVLSVAPQEPLRPMEQQIDELEGALLRTQWMAAKGNAEAKSALDEARRSGDTSKIQTMLIREADRLRSQKNFSEFSILNARIAAVAYHRGDLDQALFRARFVIHHRPTDLNALNLCAVIHNLRGELIDEQRCYELILKWSADDEPWQAFALGKLGVIYRTQGELDRSEEMHLKALAINEKLDCQEGVATQYGKLGLVYRQRGELDRAEEMHRKSLAIKEKLDRQEGMATQYGNLGIVYRTLGELDRAEEMLQKALAIEVKLGSQVDIAIQYGNLGVVYQARDELDRAEEMHQKALAINEKLDRQEGMATQYGNLGELYYKRGELSRAEEMIRKALAIEEKLGHQDRMAKKYAKLGVIAEDQGDLDRARELWMKARDLFAKIGMPNEVKQVQEWLDGLSQE